MQEISKEENKQILETRADIAKELKAYVNGYVEDSYVLLRCKGREVKEKEVVIKKIEKSKITNIAIYNSGVARYYNTFKIGNLTDLYKKSITNDYISIYDGLSKIEKEDIMCEKYPRIKPLKSCMLFSVGV